MIILFAGKLHLHPIVRSQNDEQETGGGGQQGQVAATSIWLSNAFLIYFPTTRVRLLATTKTTLCLNEMRRCFRTFVFHGFQDHNFHLCLLCISINDFVCRFSFDVNLHFNIWICACWPHMTLWVRFSALFVLSPVSTPFRLADKRL